MTLTGAQYQSMRLRFRGLLSDPYRAVSEAELDSFLFQLSIDTSSASSLPANLQAACDAQIAKALVAPAYAPNAADVTTFFPQAVAAIPASAHALTADRYLQLKNQFVGFLSIAGARTVAQMLGYMSAYFFGIVPINDAYWATGGWWDLSTIAGANNATYAAATPAQSAAALGTFTPDTQGTLPVIYDRAIGGKRGLVLDSTQPNFLRNDALAAVMNGTNKQWLVVFDHQPNIVGIAQHDNTVVSFGSDNSGSHSPKANFQFNGLGGSPEVQLSYSIIQSTGDLITTENDLSQVVAYDYYRFAASYDGTTLKTYINGVPATVTPTTWQTAAMVITRMMWGAWAVNGVGFGGANGYIRRLGVRGLPAANDAEVATIDANMVANDHTLPQTDTRVPNIVSGGASVGNGSHDNDTGMGWRYDVVKEIQDRGLNWTTVGSPQGAYALRNTVAVAGSDAPAITAAVVGALTSRTRLVLLDLGNAEINAGQTAGQVETAISTAIAAVRTAVASICPAAVVESHLIPPYSESGFNAVVISVNAALPGIWAASDAAFPAQTPIASWDANTPIGGPSYNQTNYNAGGDDHPNSVGYRLLGAALVNRIRNYLIAFSPT